MRLVCCLALLLAAVGVSARDCGLCGWIFDAESGRRVYGSEITTIDAATGKRLNVTLDKPISTEELLREGADRPFSMPLWVEDSLHLQLKINLDGYKPQTVDVAYPRDIVTFYGLMRDTVWLVPADSELDARQLINLREVTVKATKIKMVMRGDTIVYNADAFNLSTGSMLDALIAQLPGVDMNDKGQIRVNGEQVSSLLVDGKEFFQGDPTVALRNLPSYTVKNVDVYRRDPSEGRDISYALGDKKELPLVMDVRLKPQYQKGFIANAAAGYGVPDNRYMGRAFGMEYALNGRVAAYFQMNNINSEASGPGIGSSAAWSDATASAGERKIIKAGVDFTWDIIHERGKGKPDLAFSFGGNANYKRTVENLQSLTAATMFMPGSDVYRRTGSTSRSRRHDAGLDLNWGIYGIPFFGWKPLSVSANSGMQFSSADNRRLSRGADFGIEPVETRRGAALDSVFGPRGADFGTRHDIIYRNFTESDGLTRRYEAYNKMTIHQNKNFSDLPVDRPAVVNKLKVDWELDHEKSTGHDLREITYPDPAANIALRQRNRDFDRSWYISPAWISEIYFRHIHDNRGRGNLSLEITPRYTHEESRGRRRMYQLDNPFASMADAALDITNSYFSDETHDKGKLSVSLNYFHRNNMAVVNLEGEMINSHLLYRRGAINADLTRLRWAWNPSVQGRYEIKNNLGTHTWSAYAGLKRSLPDLVNLLETTDNSDPLNVYLGNPGLKPMTTLSASASYENYLRAKGRNIRLELSHRYYWNRRSQLRDFNATTGVSTYRPVNVSGAWTLGASLNVTARLDRDNKWWLTSTTSGGYEHIPDWLSLGDGPAVKSTVRNALLSENLRVNWSVAEGYTVAAGVNAAWRNARSALEGFRTINAVDIAAKLSTTMKLPWELGFSTDLNLYKRYGYEDASLNTLDWVWNASLQRAFVHGRLVVKIDAFDILGQLSNITSSVNSLGRTETWTNSLRRYAMLTLSYNFQLMPKPKPRRL